MIEDLTAFVIDVLVFGAGLVLAVAVAPFAACIGAPVLGGFIVFSYVRAFLRALLPSNLGTGGPPMRLPEPDDEPALPHYFFTQAIVDYRAIMRLTWRDSRKLATGRWTLDLARWLVTGRSPHPKRPALPTLARVFFAGVAGVVVLSGAFGAMLGGAVVLVVALAHALTIGAAVMVCMVGVVVFGTYERAMRLVLRRRMACPHPPCYAPVALPTYECANLACNRRHARLTPGRLGVLRHTCLCGQTLPTVMGLGRHRLDAYCPRPACGKQLPHGIGTAQAAHIPIVGGPSAGKTMLLMAMMVQLERKSQRGEITFDFASPSDRTDFERAKETLVRGLDLAKTVVGLPRAFLFYLGQPGRRRRLVYMYDPAGELYGETAEVQLQGYLVHASGVIMVVDPFAVSDFASTLGPDDRQVAGGARPSSEDPTATFARLSHGLRMMTEAGVSSTPVAIVIPKFDAVGQLRSSRVPLPGTDSDGLRTWLQSIGLDNLVRGVDLEFGDVGYFAVSARDAVVDPAAGDVILGPLEWLLDRRTAEKTPVGAPA